MSSIVTRAQSLMRRSTHLDSLVLVALIHLPMTFLFLAILYKSMSWETLLDTPMFMYSGFLMDHFGMAPMRDFFTYNMIGTHVLFRWLYHFFGASILGFRLADTTVLAVILVLFALILKPFGWRVAWFGSVLFGILHVTLGMHCYLQRDYIGLVPLELAILSGTAWFGRRPWLRCFGTGFFVGMLSTIKPHLMIGGIALYGYLVWDATAGLPPREAFKRAARIAGLCVAGGILPMLWMAAYLAYYGELTAFARVLVDYFPMHADISGDNAVFKPGEKLPYIFVNFFKFTAWDHPQLAFAAGTGLALFLSAATVPARLRRYGMLLATLGLVYMVYPCIAARFYEHHYYPFRLLTAIWFAFLLYKWNAATPVRVKLFASAAAVYAITSMLYINYATLLEQPSHSSGYFRTQRITNWLAPRLEPQDTVQPIEWAFCGITHALLQTKARLATHTIWGEVFFHHVSNPYVQGLRAEFIQQLEQSKPRFIIRSKTKLDYVKGNDCTASFPQLDKLLDKNYFRALESVDFVLWEANTSKTAEKDRALFANRAKRPEAYNATPLLPVAP